MYGMPGIIELPSATNLPDGQMSISSTVFGGTIRTNLSFQVLENLTGALDIPEFQVEDIMDTLGIEVLTFIIY